MNASEEHPNEPVGVRLRRLRLERGFSQRELSGPGVSYAYISRIEAGERRPSVKALRVLAAKLGVSADYLETGRDLNAEGERELRLGDAELELRLAADPADAARKLEKILAEAIAAGDTPSSTRAQLALGLAAAQADQHEDAVARLEKALAESPQAPHARPDVYATLGRSYTALDRYEEAIALFERCLAETSANAPADIPAYVRFATYLSYTLTDAGDIQRAEAVMREALKRAGRSTDPYTRVRIYWSLARLTAVEGKAAEALDYMRRAIGLLEATDDTLHLGRAHLLAARIENSQGNATEAAEHLELAESLLGTNTEDVDRGMLRLEASRSAILDGDGERAQALARESLEAFGPHHPGDLGEAWLALADSLALQDRTEDAESAYREAIPLLEAHGRSELPRAYEGLGQLLTRTGRASEAQDVLAHAMRIEASQA